MKNKILKTVLLIILAESGNFALVALVFPLHLPLFLDTVFTVAVTFYAGLVPGLIVAAAYNPLLSIFWHIFLGYQTGTLGSLYALSGMLIVLSTWIFSRKKDDFSFSAKVTVLYLLVISFVSAFASCFSAAFIDTFLRPLLKMPEMIDEGMFQQDALTLVFSRFGAGAYLSALLPRIPITVVDRIICTFAGFGVYKLYLYIENKCMGGGEEDR